MSQNGPSSSDLLKTRVENLFYLLISFRRLLPFLLNSFLGADLDGYLV
jgi:hypothetical protein